MPFYLFMLWWLVVITLRVAGLMFLWNLIIVDLTDFEAMSLGQGFGGALLISIMQSKIELNGSGD